MTPDYDQDGGTVQVMPIALDMDDGPQAFDALHWPARQNPTAFHLTLTCRFRCRVAFRRLTYPASSRHPPDLACESEPVCSENAMALLRTVPGTEQVLRQRFQAIRTAGRQIIRPISLIGEPPRRILWYRRQRRGSIPNNIQTNALPTMSRGFDTLTSLASDCIGFQRGSYHHLRNHSPEGPNSAT